MANTAQAGVHSMDHFAIQVPDLAEARAFYTVFGLDVRDDGDGLALRTFGCDQVWGRIATAPRKRLNYVAFGAYADDMPVFAQRLVAAGIQAEGDGASLHFTDPCGMDVQVNVAPKSSPDEKAKHAPMACVVGGRGNTGKGAMPKVHPTRLAHALFFTPDIKKTVDFYCSVLGLKISDFPGPIVFLHGRHGSDHHLIAFAESSRGVGYHHSSWDVDSFESVGAGAQHMALAGYGKDGWGLGRHVLGSNYFHYVRDPWNSYAEYNFDIDYIPKGMEWQPMEVPPEDVLALWGPEPPADFVTNYEHCDD